MLARQRVGVGHRIAGAEPAEAHPAEPVGHQVFRLRQRQAVQGLKPQHAELQHRLEGRPPALAQVARSQGGDQLAAEDLEIDGPSELLQRVALGREFTQPILHIPEAALPCWHPCRTPSRPAQSESRQAHQHQRVSEGVHPGRVLGGGVGAPQAATAVILGGVGC
jgi:hypothetical protein